jgi:DNA polymerase I-like protein with 3'-5' exonuclease and polymerase domains
MDVDATFRLYELFLQSLKEQKLSNTYRFVVMNVMPVLMNMELLGVRIDKNKIVELKAELEEQLKELSVQINSYAIEPVNKYKEEESIVSKIFKFKELFLKLSDPQKEYLFFSLNLLCYISARYFTLMNP